LFCGFSSIRVLPGKKQPAAQRPLSEIPVIVATTSADRVLRPSSVVVPAAGADSVSLTTDTTVSASASADAVPATDKLPPPSTVVSKSADVADVDSAQDVTVTSSTTSGGTSSILAQLSYAQPSIELLRRRREADTVDTETVTTSAPGYTRLLSSSTQAALAALASTPRRYMNNDFYIYSVFDVFDYFWTWKAGPKKAL